MGLHLFDALKKFADQHGPTIMSTPDRVLVSWTERDRAIITESDLEKNVQLCKETIMICCEKSLATTDGKEIPYLSDFEAG